MKILGKCILTLLSLFLVIALLFAGYIIFEKHITLIPIYVVVIIIFIIFCLVILLDTFSRDEVKIYKLDKLKEVADAFKCVQEKNENITIQKTLENIHKELVQIKKTISEMETNKNSGKEHIKELKTEMEKLEKILTPLDFNSDMFKAYANAVAEI